MSEIKPFEIKVSDDEIDDLKVRLENTRWPEQSTSSGWDQGVPLDYAVELMDYWGKDYNWRDCESYLNEMPHFSTVIENKEIAFSSLSSSSIKPNSEKSFNGRTSNSTDLSTNI